MNNKPTLFDIDANEIPKNCRKAYKKYSAFIDELLAKLEVGDNPFDVLPHLNLFKYDYDEMTYFLTTKLDDTNYFLDNIYEIELAFDEENPYNCNLYLTLGNYDTVLMADYHIKLLKYTESKYKEDHMANILMMFGSAVIWVNNIRKNR